MNTTTANVPSADTSLFRRFSQQEYERRHRLLEDLLDTEEVDAAAVYGDSSSRAAVQYLTGFGPYRDTYACFAPGSEAAMYVQLYNHVPTASEMAVLDRVEWGGPSSPETVAADLRKRGERLRRVGVVGPVPYAQMAALRSLLDDVEIVDLSRAFTRLRLVKSDEEIDWSRRGSELTDRAMLALAEASRPGATEYDLGSAFENAVRAGSGDPGICFLMSRPMSGSGRYVPAQHWSERVLAAGDMVVVEMSAGYGGYTGQALRTIAVDAEPTEEVVELHDLAEHAFAEITARIHPGARASDLLEAAGCIDAAGYTVCDDVVHGYGGGYLPPVLRTPATQHQPYADLELVPGMFLVVQPNVITPDRSLGVQTGHLVMVTDDGWTSLHGLPGGVLTGGAQSG